MDNSFDFNSLVGKTISSVEHIESERLPGLVRLSISFEDGTSLDLSSSGCDEGGWMNVENSTDFDA